MLAKFLMVAACLAAVAFYLRFLIAIWKERQRLSIAYWTHHLRYDWRRDFSNQTSFLTDMEECSVRIKIPQPWVSPVVGSPRKHMARKTFK